MNLKKLSILALVFLILPGFSFADISNRQINQILIGDSKGSFEKSKRNMRGKNTASFVQIGDRAALRLRLIYADKGHKDDWVRAGKQGSAQRYELTQKKNQWMKNGRIYWKRMSFYIPKGTRVLDIVSLTDIKRKKGNQRNPIVSIGLDNTSLRLRHLVGRPIDCVTGIEKGGGTNGYCNHDTAFAELASIRSIEGRWVELVYRADWQNDASGRFHLWVDGRLVVGLAGISGHYGSSIQNKFGAYRQWHKNRGQPAPDFTVFYRDVGRATNCANLELANCAQLEADIEKLGYFGKGRQWTTREREKDKWLAAGGRVRN